MSLKPESMNFSEKAINDTKAAVELLGEAILISTNALQKFPDNHYELEDFFFLTNLERFTHTLGSLKILLKNYIEFPFLETSIGLTLRASLLDSMVISYLLSYKLDIEINQDAEAVEIYEHKFNDIVSDQIYNAFKFAKVCKKSNVVSDNQYKTIIANLKSDYSFLFDENETNYERPEKNLVSKNFKTPKDLFERIRQHPILKDYSMVYDVYTYYSKYDHFGIMTHVMQRQDINSDCTRIIGSIIYIGKGLMGCLIMLNIDKYKLQDQLDGFEVVLKKFQSLL